MYDLVRSFARSLATIIALVRSPWPGFRAKVRKNGKSPLRDTLLAGSIIIALGFASPAAARKPAAIANNQQSANRFQGS